MVNTEIRLIIFFAERWRISIQSPKTRLGADYGSNYELLIAKFRLKLKKVGKTVRPFRCDLNQIPYSGSDKQLQGIRFDRVPEEVWMEVCNIVEETGIKTVPMEKKCKRQNKMVV